MAVQKSQTSAGRTSNLGGPKEIGALEAGGAVNVTLTFLWEDNVCN
jgi:hypothetical protein